MAKKKGEQLFKAEHSRSYLVFNHRPVSEDILSYSVGDVRYLLTLRDRFWALQTYQWRDLVLQGSKKRIAMSQRPDYQPHDPQKPMAPWNKDQNTRLDEWNYVPPARDYFDVSFERSAVGTSSITATTICTILTKPRKLLTYII
jgi:exonuclease 3'-5' domain-containing protein 1